MAKSTSTTGPTIGQGPAKFSGRQGSARALYHARMAQFVGKPLTAFVASVAANPPSVPAKGKLAGKPEPVSGWVSWLTRNSYFMLNS